jgi:S1-C subfamily serine protease
VKRLVVIVGAAALLAGCGGGGSDESTSGDQAGSGTTRVEVIRSIGKPGAFDPARIYKAEASGVVTVLSVFGGGGDGSLDGSDRGAPRGLGTGFVVSPNGDIVTNAHVVTDGEGSSLRKAPEVYVQFEDGNQVPAKIVGVDPNADVALLRVSPRGLRLRVLPLGSSSELQVGSPVAAIGSPFGEPQSLSVGVISATDRSITSLTGFDISGAIQTDAAINHGNSGGPLVDANGRVVGINSQIRSTGGGGEGVGFAVPVDTVKRSLTQLRDKGEASYAYVGVSTVPVYPQLGKHFHLGTTSGAWIQALVGDGPAAKAGLRAGTGEVRFQAQRFATGGDVIVAVAGRPIREPEDVSTALAPLRPGQRVKISYVRDGRERSVEVQLADRPSGASIAQP